VKLYAELHITYFFGLCALRQQQWPIEVSEKGTDLTERESRDGLFLSPLKTTQLQHPYCVI
jgi:hypothetical protein